MPININKSSFNLGNVENVYYVIYLFCMYICLNIIVSFCDNPAWVNRACTLAPQYILAFP